ncbi:MAG: glycyl-tRNA synthetase beta chain [Paracoccaceae bacterium]|jgi:glycyl-tRNA synthetase beta chain
MPDLLLELFSEEIPARMQAKAAADLKKLVTDGLVEAGLTYASAGAFSTPRRLTLTIEDLTAQSPTLTEDRKGPRVDAPEKALEGFLRSTGLSKDQLRIQDDKKGQVYIAQITKPGRPAAEIIAQIVPQVILSFPWPKSMRWGAGPLKWVRPLQSILCILNAEDGSEIVPFAVEQFASSNTTEGHRFMAPGRFAVHSFDDYRSKLAGAHVVLSAQDRAEHIWHDATTMAFAAGLEVVEDAGLLAEVSGLVEWPVVLMGQIGTDFLDLPAEVLQTSMREHQKFFSVRDPKTGRIERFITVANRDTSDNGATILAGNNKVLSARLSDAKFFWENDLRIATSQTGMQAWTDQLSNVTFHNKLGSQAERIARIAALARELAPAVGANAQDAETAAQIAKADLSSEMVYEFPELQGLMGRYYAQAAGFAPQIATACQAHYSPLGPSDDVPTEPVSIAVALADKLDTLIGFWAIDEKPTGSKDPFALRRAALGVIRLVLQNGIRLPLSGVFDSQLTAQNIALNSVTATSGEVAALKEILVEIGQHGAFGAAYRTVMDRLKDEDNAPDLSEGSLLESLSTGLPGKSTDLLNFFHDRLKVYLRDEGIPHDVIDACLAMPGADDLTLLVKRARALAAFLKTDDGDPLLQGYKRASNILHAEEAKDGVEYRYGADVKFAQTDEERALFAALETAQAAITPALAIDDFETALTLMAQLRAPVDAFFDAVQVNTDAQIIRRNRLNLLNQIRDICTRMADLSRIDG